MDGEEQADHAGKHGSDPPQRLRSRKGGTYLDRRAYNETISEARYAGWFCAPFSIRYITLEAPASGMSTNPAITMPRMRFSSSVICSIAFSNQQR